MLFFTEEDFANLVSHATRCNDIVRNMHEACGPFFSSKQRLQFGIESDYGGITGTIMPSDMCRFARLIMLGNMKKAEDDAPPLQVLENEFLLLRDESVFLDIGCGTGRPTYYFAKLALRCSMGFDIDSLQVCNSISAYTKLKQRLEFASPISFFKQDCLTLRSLGPVTHAFAFVGYPEFATCLAKLVLSSPLLKVLLLVVLKRDELVTCGLLDEETIVMGGMRMGGGTCYLGVVIPITPHRKAAIAAALQQNEDCSLDAAGVSDEHSLQVRLDAALQRGVNGGPEPIPQSSSPHSRPVRACSKRHKTIPPNINAVTDL